MRANRKVPRGDAPGCLGSPRWGWRCHDRKKRGTLPPLRVPWFLAATPPPRLRASARDHLPLGQKFGRELLAPRRWGAEGETGVIAVFFAAFAAPRESSPISPPPSQPGRSIKGYVASQARCQKTGCSCGDPRVGGRRGSAGSSENPRCRGRPWFPSRTSAGNRDRGTSR